MEKRELSKRKQIRLKGYDYSQLGYYFVTICTQNRKCSFGNIANGEMILNQYGEIVDQIVKSLTKRFPINIDICQIMPNHVHLIIVIVGARFSRPIVDFHPTLGNIIAYFKYESTKQINEYSMGRENVRAGFSRPMGSEKPDPYKIPKNFPTQLL